MEGWISIFFQLYSFLGGHLLITAIFYIILFSKSVIWKIFFPLVTLGWWFGWFSNAINYVTSDKRNCFPFSLGTKYKIEDRIEFVPKMHPSHTSLTKLVLLFQFFGGQKQEFVSGFFFFQFWKIKTHLIKDCLYWDFWKVDMLSYLKERKLQAALNENNKKKGVSVLLTHFLTHFF